MPPKKLLLRATEPESARVVAILDRRETIVGAGCLLSSTTVLTCAHVVREALRVSPGKPSSLSPGARVLLRLSGFGEPIEMRGRLTGVSDRPGLLGDLATISLDPVKSSKLLMSETEFASPFRHGGKSYSVVGFPEANPGGFYASGVLQGMNVHGLVQLDKGSPIQVEGGFSGAPVWSSDLNAFVGLIVSELKEHQVAWCIPASALCRFYPELPVRFRMARVDRPDVHDFSEDDPNIALFGTESKNAERRLTIPKIKDLGEGYRIHVRYECLKPAPPRGRFVTFITHPSFSGPLEDAYELFSELVDGIAENYFVTDGAFTVAAIGDAGDTALTYDFSKSPLWPERKNRRR